MLGVSIVYLGFREHRLMLDFGAIVQSVALTTRLTSIAYR